MNTYNINEASSSSESDGPYLVDSRYCRTTIKFIYRGTGDLLPIAAKDADRNCYCDFVFVCHDPKPMNLEKDIFTMPRSGSAMNDSSISDDDNDDRNNNNASQEQFILPNRSMKFLEQNFYPLPTNENARNNNNETTNFCTSIVKELFIKNSSSKKHININENSKQDEQGIIQKIDVDLDELIDTDEVSA